MIHPTRFLSVPPHPHPYVDDDHVKASLLAALTVARRKFTFSTVRHGRAFSLTTDLQLDTIHHLSSIREYRGVPSVLPKPWVTLLLIITPVHQLELPLFD